MQAWIQGGADKNLEWRGTETDEKHTGAGGSADVQRRVRVTVEFHGAHTSKGQTAQRSPLGGTRCSDRVRRGAFKKHFFSRLSHDRCSRLPSSALPSCRGSYDMHVRCGCMILQHVACSFKLALTPCMRVHMS